MPRTPSPSDLRLVAEAQARGVSITPRRIERLRQSGLIPKPAVRRLGRGFGTETSYPPATIEILVEVASDPLSSRNLEALLVDRFFAGRWVEPAKIRSMITRTLGRILEAIRAAAGPYGGGTLLEVAERAAMQIRPAFIESEKGRRWRRRVKKLASPGQSLDDIIHGALTRLIYATIKLPSGQAGSTTEPEDAAAEELLGLVGHDPTSTDQISALINPEGLALALHAINIETFLDIARTAAWTEIEAGRDIAVVLATHSQAEPGLRENSSRTNQLVSVPATIRAARATPEWNWHRLNLQAASPEPWAGSRLGLQLNALQSD